MNLPSKLLENAVNEVSRLPGIGRKTALRLVLWLLRQEAEVAENLSASITHLRQQVKFCRTCHNITDAELCSVCGNPARDASLVCVVEDIRDIIAIENTGNYRGLYHVLGGIISPMDGIGPKDLQIDSLEQRIQQGTIKEIIFALKTNMEGETTAFYLFRRLKNYELDFSILARGLGMGDELEYADELSLSRSLINRTPFEKSMSPKN
jgi:recombination protein RecR